jgi:hypothetical protein
VEAARELSPHFLCLGEVFGDGPLDLTDGPLLGEYVIAELLALLTAKNLYPC